MASPDTRESTWVEQIRSGNAAAFEAMFRSYYQDLVGFAFRYVHTRVVAEELVQEVFANIWERRERWNIDYTLKSYLYSAVRNQAISSLRRSSRQETWEESQLDELQYPQQSLDDDLHTMDFAAAVDEAIESLPERCRLVFVLHRKEGLTYAEIAHVLGISINTVETQMMRALKTLRKLLSDYLPLIAAFSFFKHPLT